MILLRAAILTATLAVTPFATVLASDSTLASNSTEPEEPHKDLPGDFSAMLTFTSNYVFRGVTRTEDKPALQGSLDWTHDSGAYLGAWASNVDLDDSLNNHTRAEIDLYGGFTKIIGRWGLSIAAIYYAFPGADDDAAEYSFWEVRPAVTYDLKFMTLGAYVYYSPQFFANSGEAVYYKGTVSVPIPFIPWGPELEGSIGYQTFLDHRLDNYLDWSIGLTVSLFGFSVGAHYTDADADRNDLRRLGAKGHSNAKAIATVSYTFQ